MSDITIPTAQNPVAENNNISSVNEVWKAIANLVNECLNGLGRASNRAWRLLASAVGLAWKGISWVGNKVFLPAANTGINVSGYLIDKILLGSPSLRPFLHDGLLSSDISPIWRVWVRANTGWDIYETMGPVPSNILGLLGLGVGFLNILNHIATSISYNTKNYAHLLGNRGVFGERKTVIDKRNTLVKLISGIFSLPVVIPTVALTNLLDVSLTFIQQTALSFWHNINVSYNLLGKHGVFGARKKSKDKRGLLAKIVYGIFSAPLVAPVMVITNLADACFAFIKNTAQSFWHNTRVSFNLLGKDGVFGSRKNYADKRSLLSKIVYGLISAPLVGAAITLTNTIDILGALSKNFALSFWRNMRVSYNLLGKNGVFGARKTYKDERGLPAKIVYGILSAPLVAVGALLTNAIDLTSLITKNFALSFWRNMRVSYNLLGKNGVFGARNKYTDNRNLATKVVYGLLSAPFVAATAILTNVTDTALALIKNTALSFWHNIRTSFNLLGKNGVFGTRKKYADKRSLLAKVVYGIVTSPLVATAMVFTNAVDAGLAFIKNTALSFWHNLRVSFNLLGKNGVFGARRRYEDRRSLFAKEFYGIVSAPLVATGMVISNIADGVLALLKNTALSCWHNLRPNFNLLGQKGVFGPRRQYEDKRSLLAKIVYGTISAPLVGAAMTLTNALDLLGAFTKNLALSFWHNTRVSFNLLGEKGIFGARKSYADHRGLPSKIIYGSLTAPLVFSAAAITNTIDLIASYFKNWKHTIKTPALLTTGVVGGVALAVPTFVLRKTLKGLYNLTLKPIQDKANDQPFNGWRMLRGALNVATLGLFSGIAKIFKAMTGYTHRFGFPNHANQKDVLNDLLVSEFQETQEKFQEAINLAIKGKLPGVTDTQNRIRPLLRVFYGMRNKAEEILKTLHDAYLSYARRLSQAGEPKVYNAFNMNAFFSSNECKKAEDKIKANTRATEESMLEHIEDFLAPRSVMI